MLQEGVGALLRMFCNVAKHQPTLLSYEKEDSFKLRFYLLSVLLDSQILLLYSLIYS